MFATDFRVYDYRLPYTLNHVEMIGWLDAKHDYNRGSNNAETMGKLLRLIVDRKSGFDLHVNVIRGIHPCNFCGDDISVVDSSGKRAFLGMSELWIPNGKKWYAMPSLIWHYMNDHSYIPPDELTNAIESFDLASNMVAQSAYDQAVRAKTEQSA